MGRGYWYINIFFSFSKFIFWQFPTRPWYLLAPLFHHLLHPFPRILCSSHTAPILLLFCVLRSVTLGFNQGCCTEHECEVSTQTGVTHSDYSTRQWFLSLRGPRHDRAPWASPTDDWMFTGLVRCPMKQQQLLWVYEFHAHMMQETTLHSPLPRFLAPPFLLSTLLWCSESLGVTWTSV